MHESFAYIYDEFTKSVDYKNWYKFLRRYIKKKLKVLDIGCGTATMTNMFHEDGFLVTGVDISDDMLKIAKEKYNTIDFRKLDIENEYLDEKFDYIVSNFDTVNYLKSFENFVKNCSKMQNEKATLIFDVVSYEIFDEMFENDLFIDEEENYLAIWTHNEVKKDMHEIEITAFLKKENGLYQKFVEKHSKYIYEVEYIIEILNKYGYILYDIAKNPNYGESRFFIIAKR